MNFRQKSDSKKEMTWHAKTVDETLSYFRVSKDKGLDSDQIETMREKYGSNELIKQKSKSSLVILFEQFNDPVIYILVAAAILTYVVGHPKDTIVIAFVVVLNTLIGFFQERKAADALKALQKMASPKATVIRDGKKQSIQTTDVVCGDILVLESGVKVPADARLVETHNLSVNESMLTGEAFAVDKFPNVEIGENVPLGDRISLIYSGTIVQRGRGLAVVTSVGYETEFGKISQRVAEAEETVSPLQAKIAKFSKALSIAIISIIVAIFIVGFLRGNDWVTMLMTSVGLAVSAIPEGLPVAVTITLSIGVYQMAKHNAVVKKLAAVETLGSTNVICTDKTGTLTKNEMTVQKMYGGGEVYEVTGSGYEIDGEVKSLSTGKKVSYNDSKILKYFSLISSLCTESFISKDGAKWEINGDPTEGALMIAAHKMGFDHEKSDVKVDIPFESEIQLMAVRAMNEEEKHILVKGAPEKVLEKCSKQYEADGSESPLQIEALREKVSEFSEEGLRVLALAACDECPDKPIGLGDLKDLKFVGFACIFDAVRPEAAQAVKECYNAGVRVVMITGDHVKTARAVAKNVGLAREKEMPYAVSSTELDTMSDEDLFDKVPFIDVYARVAPEHKFRIVKQLQGHQNIVSMTGDGVNDAPALKQADIGVAMGSGTDVAKSASHMVLMDDNFATIVSAVRRGRVILHNLQHIILYILCTSFGGILTIAMSVAIGLPLPVLPAQLLWINLVTDGTSTFPLAFEKEHGDVMVFPPSKQSSELVTRQVLFRIIAAGIIMMIGTLGLFYYTTPNVFDPTPEDLAKGRTLAFCVLAFFQIWNVQNSRSPNRSLFFKLPHPKVFDLPEERRSEKLSPIGIFSNKVLLSVMLLNVLLLISAVVVPFMRILFDTVPLTINEWLLVVGISSVIIIFIEAAKVIEATHSYYLTKKRINQNV